MPRAPVRRKTISRVLLGAACGVGRKHACLPGRSSVNARISFYEASRPHGRVPTLRMWRSARVGPWDTLFDVGPGVSCCAVSGQGYPPYTMPSSWARADLLDLLDGDAFGPDGTVDYVVSEPLSSFASSGRPGTEPRGPPHTQERLSMGGTTGNATMLTGFDVDFACVRLLRTRGDLSE